MQLQIQIHAQTAWLEDATPLDLETESERIAGNITPCLRVATALSKVKLTASLVV